MKKICIVIGTRPEAIKMAPVILELQKHNNQFDVHVCVTGQHASMLEGALNAFQIQCSTNLHVMRQGQTLGSLTGRLIAKLEDYFKESCFDLVLVHGDTTSAMAASIAAFYCQVDVGHVEAGLRTANLLSPFPEEYSRRLVAISAKYHFAPTEKAMGNLISEGVDKNTVLVTGNTVIDALVATLTNLQNDEEALAQLNNEIFSRTGFSPNSGGYVLITAHRRENFGEGLKNICKSIATLANLYSSMSFVYPVHLNPQVKDLVEKELGGLPNVYLIPPQDYIEFSWLMSNCSLILTDSGGIQEEAPALGKPVLVMRDTSERPEAIEAGTAKLVGTNPSVIVSEVKNLLEDVNAYKLMANAINPFGHGDAAKKITAFLMARI